MRKMIAIIRYEYKMQFQRLATWGVLLAATVFALLDNYPSASNLARLEFLNEPAYFVCRTMSLNGFVLMFGLMFLLAERFPLDNKTGMKLLLMSHALQKRQYILGKLLGGFLYAFSILCIFLALNTILHNSIPKLVSILCFRLVINHLFPRCLVFLIAPKTVEKAHGQIEIREYYHTEIVFDHTENGGDIPAKPVHEKETLCYKYESCRVFRAGSELLKDNFQKSMIYVEDSTLRK